MKNRKVKNIVVIVLAARVLASSAKCFAAGPNFCEPIKEFYGKKPSEITEMIRTRSDADRLDIEYEAELCGHTTWVGFKHDDGQDADEKTMKASAQVILTVLEKERKLKTENELKGFNFAAGIGTLYLSNHPDILATTIDNGVLRVTSDEKYKLGLWLSSHTYFDAEIWGINKNSPGHCHTNCFGLFAATQLGGDNSGVVNAFAVGLAYTPTREHRQAADSSPGLARLVFEAGFGWTRIQTLADGYTNGMTLPTGNQPVMKKTMGRGPVLIVSTDF